MKNRRTILVLVGAILLLGLIGGWWVLRQRRQAASANVAFDTVEVRRMDLSDKIDATGDVVTERNASIYSPYSATVKEILVKPGTLAHQGEVLLVLQLKDADLINYAAGWKSSLDQAAMNLAIAQKALERQTILFEAQGTTIDDFESAQTNVRQYEAQVAEYRLKLQSLTKNGVDNNNDILIKAPFDAEVSWINVKLEESVSTDDELLTLGGSSAIRVEAAVDQGDIDQIAEGQQALIQANDQNRTLIPGVVTSFGSTGATSSNVVTFPVIIKPQVTAATDSGLPKRERIVSGSQRPPELETTMFPPSGTPGAPPTETVAVPVLDVGKLLKTGMTVDVTIMVHSRSDVLVIPLRAVSEKNGETLVNVLENGQFVAKKVNLGFMNENYAEVLDGLSEGDLVRMPVTPAASGGGASKRMGGQMGGAMGPPPM